MSERHVDVLGEPWTAETLELEDDFEGPVVATLVHRPAVGGPTGRAVLHVHGFADYFFQAEYGDWWAERGYDVYALDLRKYGRSLRPGQTPNFVADLSEHHAELDAAWDLIVRRDGHSHVVGSGHSTGGLTLPLWCEERQPGELAGMVLNSPWLDLRGSVLLRTIGTAAIDRLGAAQPLRIIPRKVSGLYSTALHRDLEGEWDYDLDWKPLTSFPVYAGWLRAVRRAHARLHRGIDVGVPVLVLSSDRSSDPDLMGEDVRSTDIVLDVEQIRRWSTALSRHVTYVAVPGAMHDVVLSRPPVRAAVYQQIGRWHDAHVRPLVGDGV